MELNKDNYEWSFLTWDYTSTTLYLMKKTMRKSEIGLKNSVDVK